MNFSYEELYNMYGQYDTLITMDFHYNSEAYKTFGPSLMGEIFYTEDDRIELEKLMAEPAFPRSDRRVRIIPSKIAKLNAEQFEKAERYGIQASDIYEISSYNKPRENQFTGKGKKELSKPITINVNYRANEINRISYGFLFSRLKRNSPLSPNEEAKLLGLARYFGEDISIEPFNVLNVKEEDVRYHELEAKYFDLTIEGEDIKEFGSLIADRYIKKEKLINEEIKLTGEKLDVIAKKHGDEIKNLKKAAHQFEEDIILFGKKLIYLDVERFLHIYARHVTETHAGGNFEIKTVFQYKYEDIMRLIKEVVESASDEIQKHFQENPNKGFFRLGKRAVYYQGHYYRVDIEPTGRLTGFHPYNNNEEQDADDAVDNT